MATKTLTGNVIAQIDWSYENADDHSTAKDADRLKFTQDLDSGTAAGEVEILFKDRRSVGASTTTEDLDLAGVLGDIYGATLTFTKVKGIMIINRATTATDVIKIGGGGSGNNAWGTPFDGSQDAKITLQPESAFLLGMNQGLTVTAGTGDKLRITYAGTSGSITYDVVILGND